MVSEPTLLGLKSMASANKMRRLKYSCEEVYERMDNGLCIFCDELDTPGHHDLKHKGIQIFIVDDDLASDDIEEFHQTQETVTEPIVEIGKNLDSFIEPLVHESVSQVLDSVPDVFMVCKVDSHVKEVEESPQQSTISDDENVAYQVFDQMPQRKAEEEKQQTEALRSELDRMLAELKTMTANREATMSKFLSQASIPPRPPFPPPDPPDMCRFEQGLTDEIVFDKDNTVRLLNGVVTQRSKIELEVESIETEEESRPEEASTHKADLDFGEETMISNAVPSQVSLYHLPVFDGTLPDCWIMEVDRFFELEKYENEEKLNLISLSVEGAALKWFRKHRREFTDWTDIKRKLMARFGLVKGCSPPEVLPKEKFITKVDQDTNFGSEKEPTNSVEITSIKGHEVQGTTVSHLATSCVDNSVVENQKKLAWKDEIPVFEHLHEPSRLFDDESQGTLGGSPLEHVDKESSGDVKFHLKHKWRSRVLPTLSGLEFCLLPAKLDLRDWPKEESKQHKRKSHQIETFEVLSSLEPSRRYHKESLVVVNDLSSDLGCVIGKTIGSICDSEIGQDNSLDKEEFVGIVGTKEKLYDRLSLANYVWKPGELLCVQDQRDWISEVHSGELQEWNDVVAGHLLFDMVEKGNYLDEVIEEVAKTFILAMIDEPKDIKTACVLLEMSLNRERLIQLGAPPVFIDLLCAMNRIRVRLKMLLLLEFLWLILFTSKMFKSSNVPQNKNQTEQKLSSYWKFLLSWKIRPNIHVSSRCVLRQEESYVKVLELIKDKDSKKRKLCKNWWFKYKLNTWLSGALHHTGFVKIIRMFSPMINNTHWDKETWVRLNLESCKGGSLLEFLKRHEARFDMVKVPNNTKFFNYLKFLVKSYILRIEDALKERKFVKFTMEQSEKPLITILSYEWFHSPRPPELSCCKEDEESTAKITSLRTRMI